MYVKEGALKETPTAEGAQKRIGDHIWLGGVEDSKWGPWRRSCWNSAWRAGRSGQ